jgi:hypothetical protein
VPIDEEVGGVNVPRSSNGGFWNRLALAPAAWKIGGCRAERHREVVPVLAVDLGAPRMALTARFVHEFAQARNNTNRRNS